ncbi:MAG TPA: hypothetical protein VI195_03390 [Steroidobacteraceae bacterium]
MTDPSPRGTLLAATLCLLGAALAWPGRTRADAGPPFLTNDPGTPGNGNWEINIAAQQTTQHGLSVWQLPQLDINYGVGERIQLTAEIPYVVLNSTGQPRASGWGNANPGVKWRFFVQGESGWQISTFPTYQTGGSADAQRKGIAVEGPRIFLPLAVARKVGRLSLNLEVGTYVPIHGEHERVIGLVAGQQITSGLELDVELYNDYVHGGEVDITTLDVGGRYKLHRGVQPAIHGGPQLERQFPRAGRVHGLSRHPDSAQ